MANSTATPKPERVIQTAGMDRLADAVTASLAAKHGSETAYAAERASAAWPGVIYSGDGPDCRCYRCTGRYGRTRGRR